MKCEKNKIFNALTGRCIFKYGKLAKKLNLSPSKKRKSSPFKIKKSSPTRQKKFIKGGIILGSGMGGATVISPALPCGMNNSPEYLNTHASKVFHVNEKHSEQYYKRETRPELIGILKKIDPHQERFVYALESKCSKPSYNIKDLNLQTINDLVQIGINNIEIYKTTNDFNYFNMKLIGKTFEDITQFNLTQEKYLKESVEILHQNGICHLDLHKGNIVVHYNIKEWGFENKPLIIDFGLSKLESEAESEKQWNEYLEKEQLKLITLFEKEPPPRGKRKRARGSGERGSGVGSEEGEDDDGKGSGGGGGGGGGKAGEPPKISRNLFEEEGEGSGSGGGGGGLFRTSDEE
jgi:hypothetical protein